MRLVSPTALRVVAALFWLSAAPTMRRFTAATPRSVVSARSFRVIRRRLPLWIAPILVTSLRMARRRRPRSLARRRAWMVRLVFLVTRRAVAISCRSRIASTPERLPASAARRSPQSLAIAVLRRVSRQRVVLPRRRFLRLLPVWPMFPVSRSRRLTMALPRSWRMTLSRPATPTCSRPRFRLPRLPSSR